MITFTAFLGTHRFLASQILIKNSEYIEEPIIPLKMDFFAALNSITNKHIFNKNKVLLV